MTIVARATFYPLVLLDGCLYKYKNNIKMLYYDRIDVSEGIYVNKASVSKLCDVCHYWYFSKFSLARFNQMSTIDVMIY